LHSGIHQKSQVIRGAQDWFDTLFVRTGIQKSIWHFIPSEAERQGSMGFEDVGRDNLFPFVAERIRVLWDSLYAILGMVYILLLSLTLPFPIPIPIPIPPQAIPIVLAG
jgi:hypothetical protein